MVLQTAQAFIRSPFLRKALTQPQPIHFCPQRSLWNILNSIFNKPDIERIKEVGPDRSCAEWLLKCGAHVRWVGFDTFLKEFNSLPRKNFEEFKIEEVNAENAGVMDIGFRHFRGCMHIKKMRFHHCASFEDDCLDQIRCLSESLEDLEVTSCGDLTDKGLIHLYYQNSLKRLMLKDLPSVRDKKGALVGLQKALPECDITLAD